MDISTDESLILTRIDGENANLDVSQISGWSAMTPGWNDSFKFDFDDSVHASNLSLNPDDNFSNIAKTTVEEIFVENCCTFYNDILNAVDDLEFEEQIQCFESFENRQKLLTEQAKLLAESVPDLAETVQLRMQAINRAMEQLKIKQNFENAKNNCAKIQKSAPQKFREWLQKIEKELERFRIGLGGNVFGSITSLQKLASDHQIFQQQIESEGQNLLSEVKKYYNSKKFQENSEKKDRSKRTLDLLEQRLLTSWLKSLENLERISTLIRNLKESKENLNSLSEDDEPLTKRRRTLSAEIQLDFQTPFFPAFSPCSTIDSDGLLIPSSTESEFGNQEDDSESQNMPENFEQDWNLNASTKQLCDVGYSSGENSIHEAVSGLDTELKNDKIFVKTTPTKMLYRTVPLDDAGLTDEEYFKGQGKMVEIELPNFANLSDSLVVQNSSQNNMLLDDFDQVMEMMDSDSIFVQKMDELKNGTNWREMKKKNERISIFKEKRERIRTENDESREASSEESDSGKKINISSTASSAALPPIPGQRKRKIKKAVRNEKNNLNCFLSSVAMDETIYIPSNPSGLMSQSFNDSSTRRGMISKRKLEKLRMNRSFSDHYNLNLNFNQMTNSFSSQKSTTSSIFGSVLSEFNPLITSTMKRNGSNNLTVRRLSVDSLASTTSSGTVHETGDANYEWDEYKDPPSLPDMSDIFVPYASLENIDVDEDYQLHLAMPDPNLVNSTINKSKQNYFNIRQMIDDYSALDEEKEDIRSALRLSAKKNVSKLTAIVQGIPRSNMNREQINDLEELQKQWKWTLDELGNDEMEMEMEKDWENVKNIQNCLAEIREILKNLMEVDAKSLKIEDLEKFIFERKNLWEKLIQNKEFLEKMAKTTGNQYNNGELTVLLKNVENSLEFVGNGTDVLRESMIKYQSLGDIRQGLMDLDKKMDGFEGGNRKNLIEDVETDLNVCKNRLDALETVCTNLTMQLGDIAALNGRTKPGRQTDFWKEFRGFRSEFERLKLRFSKLSTDSKKSQSNITFLNGKFGNGVRNRKSKAKDSDTSTTLSTRNSPTQNPQKMNFVSRIGNTVRNSRIVQLLLGFTAIFILGLIFINFYLDDSPKNNWRRMFGPQLDYVNGPPPM